MQNNTIEVPTAKLRWRSEIEYDKLDKWMSIDNTIKNIRLHSYPRTFSALITITIIMSVTDSICSEFQLHVRSEDTAEHVYNRINKYKAGIIDNSKRASRMRIPVAFRTIRQWTWARPATHDCVLSTKKTINTVFIVGFKQYEFLHKKALLKLLVSVMLSFYR